MLLIIFCLILGLSYPALAAEKTKPEALATPVKTSGVKTIFDYKDELGLIKNQTESIKNLVDNNDLPL